MWLQHSIRVWDDGCGPNRLIRYLLFEGIQISLKRQEVSEINPNGNPQVLDILKTLNNHQTFTKQRSRNCRFNNTKSFHTWMLEESLQQQKKRSILSSWRRNPRHSHNNLVVLCNYQFVEYRPFSIGWLTRGKPNGSYFSAYYLIGEWIHINRFWEGSLSLFWTQNKINWKYPSTQNLGKRDLHKSC